jgi:serine phosphatase RsbU (regulator of sigma subunit)
VKGGRIVVIKFPDDDEIALCALAAAWLAIATVFLPRNRYNLPSQVRGFSGRFHDRRIPCIRPTCGLVWNSAGHIQAGLDNPLGEIIMSAIVKKGPVISGASERVMGAAAKRFRRLDSLAKGGLQSAIRTLAIEYVACRIRGIAPALGTTKTAMHPLKYRGIPAAPRRVALQRAGPGRADSQRADRIGEISHVADAVSNLEDVRLDLLQRACDRMGVTLDIHHTAAELAALAVPKLADRATVDLLDPVLNGEDPLSSDSGALRFRRVAVRDSATEATIEYAVGDLIAQPAKGGPAVTLSGETLLARNPREMRQAGLAAEHVEALLDRGVHTFMMVPLTARGAPLGAVGFGRAEHQTAYNEADVRLLSDLAEMAAVHIDNARLYTLERDAAATLQRSLLPRDIPTVAGLDIAYRYQPASRAAEIGGDWFDVIPLDGGRVALVVGDVTGHGISAAAIMGQLRTTTAALARLGCPPDQIMGQLSALVAGHGDEAGATCLYAVYDPRSQRCDLASAGHPPPVLRRPGGTAEVIDLPPGLLLGAGQSHYPVVDLQLRTGSVLALYTDGLIEQPGEDIATGMTRLTRALADGPARSPDDLCDSVLARLAPRPRDDIALLLARTTTAP